MELNEIAALGYAISMVAFGATVVLYLSRWMASPLARPLLLATASSAAWGGMLTLHSLGFVPSATVLIAIEWLHYGAWIAALYVILGSLGNRDMVARYAKRYAMPLAFIAAVAITLYSLNSFDSLPAALVVGGNLVAAMLLIGLSEQAYRNLPSDSTSGFKYVCVTLFLIALFDIGMFARAISVQALENDAWAARGFISTLVVFPLMLYGQRSSTEGATERSRQIVFRSFFLLATAAGLTFWLATEYLISTFGSNWSSVAKIIIPVGVIGVVAVLLASATIRSRVRVFLTKVLFRYKYDYRNEWLRFIGTLSESGMEKVPTTSVRAVAQIVNSPGGIVWTRAPDGDEYIPAGSWRADLPVGRTFNRESSLVRFLRYSQWVIDLNEMQSYPSRYQDLQLDDWIAANEDFWLVVPMLVGKRLYGFIILKKPRLVPTLNFEDHDLLRTVGRHAGTHIKQAELDKRLAESSQFGTYHRLSAFLMHDLNNLIAQQSMVVKNAEKFREDPRFIDDTVDTIAHSVSRMRRLMEQLTSVTKTPQSTRVSLREVLESAVQSSSSREPQPTLSAGEEELYVTADPERLTQVVEHLVRNAQEATGRDGSVTVTASAGDGTATIVISDTGCGMSAEFVSERLFRPFDSTKGSQSMGIGAYQAREYVEMLGGRIEVESVVEQGTTFSLRLPVA
jgi:putative PEP-CTERM system histidine kinase